MVENKVILIGRFTADPELRKTQSDISVSSFTLAVNKPYNKDHEHPEADFINCVAWRGTAEFITKYFGKGSRIAICGHIQTRKYDDKDGNKRTAFEVVIDEATFIDKKKDNTQSQADNADTSYADTNNDIDASSDNDDDLPF